MKFIDEAVIKAEAGKGGAGARHFRREKFVPLGGPDGGNGGAGGSVILRADRNKHTLVDFTYRHMWKAEDGQAGQGSCRDGKAGEDLIIQVPVGTQIIDEATGDQIADLTEDCQDFVLAKGGRGGRGNTFFKSATNQAPDYAQPGEEGTLGTYRMSLKVVADVGLIGFPNAGKSTLISRISAARPKIADYPFTTLEPNLGVVSAPGGRSYVVADIPGLIPDAHLGKGLGVKFLKHIERTRVLAHLIDLWQIDENGEPTDPLSSYDMINRELNEFSSELSRKSQIVVLTKSDALPPDFPLMEKIKSFQERGLECLVISSVSGDGVPQLVELLARHVEKARQLEKEE